jgi:tetratricopeptide (TPR) repeat protein
MPVKEFFEDQLKQMQRFMANPREVVRVVHVDPDMKPVLRKMLAGYDRDPNTPHVIIPSDASFMTRDCFFESLYANIVGSYEASAIDLMDVGFMEPFSRDDLARDRAENRITIYLGTMAESLPDHVGSLVVLLEPQDVHDAPAYRKALAWLAENTWSRWVKFLVIDERLNPKTADLERQTKKIGRQTLYLSPDDMEKRVAEAVMTDPMMSIRERGQYTGMLAGFALARKQYDAAMQAFRDQLALIRFERRPADEAPIHYGLGNVYLAKNELQQAEAAYGDALNLVIEHKLDALKPLVLTQLAVTLMRQERPEAELCFELARDASHTIDSPPTEAFTLDCQAQCHVQLKQYAEAEKCWQKAMAIYDGITSEAMADVRKSGRADIRHKLEHFYKDTRQTTKLSELGVAS